MSGWSCCYSSHRRRCCRSAGWRGCSTRTCRRLIARRSRGIALLALLHGAVHAIAMAPGDVATALRLSAEHDAVLGIVEQIRTVADALST